MKVIPNSQNEQIKRLNEIYQVLKKNDFGYLIEEKQIQELNERICIEELIPLEPLEE